MNLPTIILPTQRAWSGNKLTFLIEPCNARAYILLIKNTYSGAVFDIITIRENGKIGEINLESIGSIKPEYSYDVNSKILTVTLSTINYWSGYLIKMPVSK